MKANSKLEKFKELLRKLFQFDVADLDFGIYRILNEKRDDIERFIEEDLVEGVREEMRAYERGQTESLQQEVANAKQIVKDTLSPDAIRPDGSVKEEYRSLKAAQDYLDAKERLETAQLTEETERRIYDDLTRFFRRYYDRGDFVTKRRFSSGDSTYYVPYDGEEILFHWSNRDHYFIKTSEHFRNYRFKVRGLNVQFELVEAQTPQDDVKAGDTRYFVLQGEDPIDVRPEEDICKVRFAFRPITEEEDRMLLEVYNQHQSKSKKRKTNDQSTIVEATVRQIIQGIDNATVKTKLSEPENGEERGPLRKHLKKYTGKHTSDYFIHKDINKFLKGQLEFFVQNEVLELTNVLEASEQRRIQQINRAKAVKKIGERIISFLSQTENFQKRLFEKKKFVVDTGYCVTLDRVPDDLYHAILDNESQLNEWRDLYNIDEWEDSLFKQGYKNGEFTRAFLEAHPYAIIDTQHFDQEFEDRLLSHLSNTSAGGLDEATDGLCIQGENFQALNLLEERFRGKVSCTYIDPPYNTGNNDFPYKDNYQHSTWLSMMYDRVQAGKSLSSDDSAIFVSIDDDEQHHLRKLLDTIYGEKNFVANIIWQKKYSPANDATWFSDDHDFVLNYAKNKEIWTPDRLPRTEEQNAAYKNPDNDSRGRWKSSDYTGPDTAEEAPQLYYPITNPNTGEEIWPSKDAVWRYTKERHKKNVEEDRVWWGSDGTNSVPAYKRFLSEVPGIVPRTVWTWEKAGHNQKSIREIKSLFGNKSFPTPKPISLVRRILQVAPGLVLDYFAGSGSTGHAVINMNRDEDVEESNREYILVEMGEYFDDIMLPRLKKAVFSDEWDEAVPQTRNGQSHVIKYHRLESYEDSLNNIEVDRTDTNSTLVDKFDDYALKYMIPKSTEESETLLAPDAFKKPFDYTLQIQHGIKSPSLHEVDLEATFNYLIGLEVNARHVYEHQDRRYVVVTGTVEYSQSIEEVMVVWRSQVDLDLEDERVWSNETLPDGPFDKVYVNGPSHIYGQAEPLEIRFRERMDPAAG